MNNFYTDILSHKLGTVAVKFAYQFMLDTYGTDKNLIQCQKRSYVFCDLVRTKASEDFRSINKKQFRFKKWRFVVSDSVIESEFKFPDYDSGTELLNKGIDPREWISSYLRTGWLNSIDKLPGGERKE